MTDDEQDVLEAVSRGRLIVPFQDELMDLRDEAAAGPLTGPEQDRLTVLERAYKQAAGLDDAFHNAMELGDYAAAQGVAEQMLAIAGVVG